MLLSKTRGLAAALALALTPSALMAGAGGPASTPTAVDVLFEAKHVDGLEKGTELAYRFERKVSDAKLLGEPFADDIKISVNSVSEKGRELTMNIFTGERARDPQIVPDFSGNPLLILFLDRCVNNYSSLGGGDRPYLKGAFRNALREKATIEAAKIDYQGKSVDGYRIKVVPYVGDRNAAKMRGYENSHFSFVLSPAVPGHFVELAFTIESSKPDLPRVEERMTIALAKAGETK